MLQGQARVPILAFVPDLGRPRLARPREGSASYTPSGGVRSGQHTRCNLVSKPLVLIDHIYQRPTLIEPDAVVYEQIGAPVFQVGA